MLIVAISFGHHSDPFTRTCIVKREEVDVKELSSIIPLLYKEYQLPPFSIDEVLVIENDEVISRFDFDDGLGQPLEDEDVVNVFDPFE